MLCKKITTFLFLILFVLSPLSPVFAFEEKQETTASQEVQDSTETIIPIYYFIDQYGGILGIAPINKEIFLWAYVFLIDHTFDGQIDEVRLYSRALTPQEILSLYQNPATVNNSSLAAYWKFDTANEQRKYAGQEYDVETGLSYMSAYGGSTGGGNARYYNGKMGRFVSQDSLVLNTPEKVLQDPQALNSYAYARNNPLIYVDPTGNFFETAWDVGNLVYDAGRLVKNTVEVNVGLAKYGYGVITKNQALQNSALTQMSGDLGDLKSAGIDTAFDAGATMIPFVPAGMTKVVGKADDAAKFVNKGINSSVGGKSVFRRAAEHSVNDHNDTGHYLGKSVQEVEDIARNAYNNFDVKANIKDIKQYYYNSKTNDLFINNPIKPTVFQPKRGIEYLRKAVSDDIKRGGVVK